MRTMAGTVSVVEVVVVAVDNDDGGGAAPASSFASTFSMMK